MNENVNALNWFEISVSDMARATKFYETIFGIKLDPGEMPGAKMAMFPSGAMNGKVGGTLVESPRNKPSMDGAKIYLNANPDLQLVLDKVEEAGGKIVMPKTDIGNGVGFMAFFTDCEGNAMALHSNN